MEKNINANTNAGSNINASSSCREIIDREYIHDSLKKDTKIVGRLERAWKNICESHLEEVRDLALIEGPGACIFQLFRPGERKEHNCDLFYLQKSNDLWKEFLKDAERTEFESKYDENSMLCICISMPLYDIGDERLEDLKLFDAFSLKEICLD